MTMQDWTVSARWSWDEQRKRMAGATDEIIREVANKWGITVKEIVGPRRTRFVAWARFEACYRIRKECPWMSLPMIGRKMGNRDHTSILNAVRRYQALTASGELEIVRDGRKKREGRTTRKEEERMASTLARPVTEAGA